MNVRPIFLVLILWFLNGECGSVEKYFQKISQKSGGHHFHNIDFIYMINLDKRPEKYEQTRKILEPFGIYPYRFSAVNGWKLSFETLCESGVIFEQGMKEGPIGSVFRYSDGKEYMSFEIMKEVGVSYFCHSMSRGAIGCILSHLSVLQDAYDSGYETIWIVEDDVKVVSDPHELCSHINILDSLAPGWDILFTDDEAKNAQGNRVYCGGIRPRPKVQLQPHAFYTQRTYINGDIIKVGLRFGSYSMIVKRSGMKKLLDYFKTNQIYFPYDMDYCFVPDIKMYQCTKDIVTNISGGISDIGTSSDD